MPTSSSTSGWNTLRPKAGRTSTTKMALPSATGSVKSVERTMTPKDVTMSGSAPYFPSEGTQLVPVMNAPKSIPSTNNAERPCPATMTIKVTTMRATRATHAPVRPRPTFSRRRFGSICLAIKRPFAKRNTKRGAAGNVSSRQAPHGKRRTTWWSRCPWRPWRPSCRKRG